MIGPVIKQELYDYQLDGVKIFGDSENIQKLGNNITLNNVYLNCNSGKITIHDYVDIAYNVMIITGSHDFTKIKLERTYAISDQRDIVIEEGVFIGSGAIILGPCTIGKNSVIGAGSVVTKNIPENVIAAGNPCKVIKTIQFS